MDVIREESDHRIVRAGEALAHGDRRYWDDLTMAEKRRANRFAKDELQRRGWDPELVASLRRG